MKAYKTYVSAGIFIVLSAVKLLFPQVSAEICEGITKTLKFEEDHTEMLLAFGSDIAKNGIIETLGIGDLEFLSD